METPKIGTRFSLAGSLGTIKFAGNVDNTKGLWLGVEWDDPQRGKHSGTKDGKQYFQCRIPNAGSFIRPNATICYGSSFLDALTSKYIELNHGSESMEKVTLGSSNGVIEVEAVNLDKIRGKFARLERLREISVDYENVALADAPGKIRDTCPNVQGLDLSSSLLPSWDMVALIAVELPLLERLALNRNRFRPFEDIHQATQAFAKLTELQLNQTLMIWSEMETIAEMIPTLRNVEMGYNRLTSLHSPSNTVLSNIQLVNLDGNEIKDWDHIHQRFQFYPSLQRLIVTSNGIEVIPSPSEDSVLLSGLRHLALAHNAITAWSTIDSLSQWCPILETLSLSGSPLVDTEMGKNVRQFVIAKIPTLLILDAAAISSRERTDCEIFYLSHIAKAGPASDDDRRREHPQWDALCEKHGKPESVVVPKQDKLSNQLISLNVHQVSVSLDTTPRSATAVINSTSTIALRVLPTMTVRIFRMKVFKNFKVPGLTLNQTSIKLWLKMQDGAYATMDRDHDDYDLDWWGLDNSSDIYVKFETS